jgi:hypothetical protein
MKKRVLIVGGGWEEHEPKQCAELFAGLLAERGFDVVVRDSLDAYTDALLMQSLSLVVPIWTMGTITKEQERGLLETAGGPSSGSRRNPEVLLSQFHKHLLHEHVRLVRATVHR